MDNQNDESGKTKFCKKCQQTLPLSEFYKRSKAKDGLAHWCKSCTKTNVLEWQKKYVDRANIKSTKWKQEHGEQVKKFNATYRETNRERLRSQGRAYMLQKRHEMSFEERQISNRRIDLKRKYGVTIEWYNARLVEQDGRCAICNDPVGPARALAVDHCHKTLQNRGLLCGHCNPLLHKLEADSDWMAKAVEYLNSHSSGTVTAEREKAIQLAQGGEPDKLPS